MAQAAIACTQPTKGIALYGVSTLKNALVAAAYVFYLALVGLEGVAGIVHGFYVVMLSLLDVGH